MQPGPANVVMEMAHTAFEELVSVGFLYHSDMNRRVL